MCMANSSRDGKGEYARDNTWTDTVDSNIVLGILLRVSIFITYVRCDYGYFLHR
jgi:hypothetical protein